MANISKDLWGELGIADLGITPVGILNEQASLLDEKSNNRLRGEILSRVFTASGSDQERMVHLFYIVVPGLKNRRKELMRIAHDVHTYFPLSLIVAYEKEKVYKLENLENFEKKLSEVLSDKRTRRILQTLIGELNKEQIALAST